MSDRERAEFEAWWTHELEFSTWAQHVDKKRALRIWQARGRIDAERIANLGAAVKKLLNAMEMQEGREKGEFHIRQPTAKCIWDDAKAVARAALATTEGG